MSEGLLFKLRLEGETPEERRAMHRQMIAETVPAGGLGLATAHVAAYTHAGAGCAAGRAIAATRKPHAPVEDVPEVEGEM